MTESTRDSTSSSGPAAISHTHRRILKDECLILIRSLLIQMKLDALAISSEPEVKQTPESQLRSAHSRAGGRQGVFEVRQE